MNRTRLQKILIAIFAVLVLGALLVRSTAYTVSERELAVVLRFGEVVDEHTEPGLYFKLPIVHEVRRFPKTKQFWHTDLSRESPLVDLPTEDGKKIEIAAWAVWRITDPAQFQRVVRTVTKAETDHVQPRVRSAIRNAVTDNKLAEVVRSSDRELTYSIQAVDFEDADGEVPAGEIPNPQEEEVISEDQQVQPGEIQDIEYGREEVIRRVRETVRRQLGETGGDATTRRGIELVDVGISNISFVPSVREAAFARLKASMEAIAARYEQAGKQRKQEILNETQAEVQRIEGEGEEQSQIIRGQADAEIITGYAKAIQKTGDFYNFIKTLEVNEESLKGRSRLILTTDSELFRLLKELAPTEAAPATAPATAADGGETAEEVSNEEVSN